MDLREAIIQIAQRGVALRGDDDAQITARATDIQLREGAPIFVRLPQGYSLIAGETVTRKALEDLFYFLIDLGGRQADPGPSGLTLAAVPASGIEPRWRRMIAATPMRSIAKAISLYDKVRLRATLFETGEADDAGRFQLAASIRLLPAKVPTLEALNIGPMPREWIRSSGLILVTGPTGMGKSTTIAALLNYVNNDDRFGSKNIITLENPIEYELQSRYSIIAQRLVGNGGVERFSDGISAAMRQRPDILMVGEILDLDSARAALRAATSGHTVLTTVHGDSATGALQTLLGFFDRNEAEDRAQELARALIGVTYQRLVPSIDGARQYLAAEILSNTQSTVGDLIAARRLQELDKALASVSKYSWPLESELANLVKRQLISSDWADALCNDRQRLQNFLHSANIPAARDSLAAAKV